MDIVYVRKGTKAELIRWKSACKPSSPQHIAANVELVRRDDQLKSRLWTVFAGVAVAVIAAVVVWFR